MDDETKRRLQYAGAIGLLCECAVQVDEDTRDCIQQAVDDFCALTGWTNRRVLNRIEVEPPESEGDSEQFRLAADELERVTKERDALLSQVACNHPRQYHDEPCPDCGWKEPE